MIVDEESYEVSEPTIDTHIVKLKSTGADVFFNVTTPKFAAQAIKKNCRDRLEAAAFPQQRLGLDRQRDEAGRLRERAGIISSTISRIRPTRSGRTTPAMKAWNEFLDKYYPEANRADASVMYGYTVAQGLVQVLKQCGDDLTRENVMKQAASLKDLELGGLLPGIKVNTSADRFRPDFAVAVDEVQGRDVGAVRRHHQRRRRRLTNR